MPDVCLIREGYVNLIPFFFSGYQTLSSPISYVERPLWKVLYILKPADKIEFVRACLGQYFYDYIIVTVRQGAPATVSLVDSDSVIKSAQSRFGLHERKGLIERCKRIEDEQFTDFMKHSIIHRSWQMDRLGPGEKIYKLFEALKFNKKEFLRLLHSFMKEGEPEVLMQSLLTVFLKAKNFEEQKEVVSDYYREVLKVARIYLSKMREPLLDYVTDVHVPSDIRLMRFFWNMR